MLLTLPFTTPALLPSAFTNPDFRVEWAPGKHPLDPPAAADWEPLLLNGKTRLVSCLSDTGRQDDLNAFEPLSATLVLDGSDGELDEADPTSMVSLLGAGLPYTPMRVVASLDGGAVWYPLFSGFIDHDGWSPQAAPGDTRKRTTVRLTDWLGWAKSLKMPPTRWDWWVASNAPDAWITGKMDAGFIDGADFGEVAYDDGVLAGQYDMLAGDTPTHVTAGDSIVTGNSAAESSIVFTTGDYLDSQNELATTDDVWSVAFWFKQPDTASSHMLVGGHLLGTMRWSVSIASGGNVFVTTYDTSGSSDTVTVSGVHDDGAPHLVVATWNATTQVASIRTDLGSNSSPWFLGSIPWRGSGGTLRMGDSGAAVVADEQIQDVAYFGGKDIYSALKNPDDLYYFTGAVVNAATVVGGTDYIGALLYSNAVAFLFDAARVGSAVSYDVDKTTLYDRDILNRTPVSADLGAAMVELADSDRGAVYALRDGTVRFRDVDAANSLTKYVTPIITLTDENDAATLYGGQFLAATARSRTGRRVDRVINYVTQPRLQEGSPAPTWTQRHTLSIRRYGHRQLDLTCRGYYYDNVVRPSDFYGDGISNEAVKGRTQSIIDQYAEPPIEVGEITLKPIRSLVEAIFAIKDLELEVPITYVEDGLINDTFRVQHIQWKCNNAADWSVSLWIAPVVVTDVAAF